MIKKIWAFHRGQQLAQKVAMDAGVMISDLILINLRVTVTVEKIAAEINRAAFDVYHQSHIMPDCDSAFHIVFFQNCFDSWR